MPYKIEKRGLWWLTINKETGAIRGRHKTKKLAQAQANLIMGTKHGWKPNGKR